MKTLLSVLIVIASWTLTGAAAAASAGAEVEYHAVPGDADMPFSAAVRVGDMLYLSGTLGIDPGTGRLVEGGISAETKQLMENIAAALVRYGSSLDRVVKCTVFLADIEEWAAMNAVYRSFFGDHPPARSALGASGLALDARVEIECMATVN
jgi:2-iminobutanoate/2-iminopropanoate deaminase